MIVFLGGTWRHDPVLARNPGYFYGGALAERCSLPSRIGAHRSRVTNGKQVPWCPPKRHWSGRMRAQDGAPDSAAHTWMDRAAASGAV